MSQTAGHDAPHGSAGPARIIRLSWELTALFAALTVATHLLAERLDSSFAVVCAALAAVGIALFLLGFWNGAQRSRTEDVTLSGLLAANSSHVPARQRNLIWAPIIAQVIIGVVAASLRPFTPQVFALLVPLLGLGLAGLWGSRFAQFHPRETR